MYRATLFRTSMAYTWYHAAISPRFLPNNAPLFSPTRCLLLYYQTRVLFIRSKQWNLIPKIKSFPLRSKSMADQRKGRVPFFFFRIMAASSPNAINSKLQIVVDRGRSRHRTVRSIATSHLILLPSFREYYSRLISNLGLNLFWVDCLVVVVI